jgi:hypothetical protein
MVVTTKMSNKVTIMKALSAFRVGSRLEEPGDRLLSNHITVCKNSPCVIDGCEFARSLMHHVQTCETLACRKCTVLKLLELRKSPLVNTDGLEQSFTNQFGVVSTLFETIRNLNKLCLVKVDDAKYQGEIKETIERTKVLMVHESNELIRIIQEVDRLFQGSRKKPKLTTQAAKSVRKQSSVVG